MNLYECLHMYIFIYTCMIIILKFKKNPGLLSVVNKVFS